MRHGIIKLTDWGHSGQGYAISAQGSVRGAAGAGEGSRGSRIDGMTGAHVFSYSVSTISDGKDVTATMKTAVNEIMKITYRCHADGFDVRAENFMWSTKALAFKRAFDL